MGTNIKCTETHTNESMSAGICNSFYSEQQEIILSEQDLQRNKGQG